MPKRYTYNSCGDFFWAKQEEHETPEEHWRKLASLERNCEVIGIKQKDLLLSKFITRSTDEKNREKVIREKTQNLKTNKDLETQDSYEKRNKQLTIPTALVNEKEIKHRTNTENTRTTKHEYWEDKNKNTNYGGKTQKKNNCGFCRQQYWTPLYKCKTSGMQHLSRTREFRKKMP